MISERTIRPITLFKYVCSRANIVSKVRQKSKQNCDCVCVCVCILDVVCINYHIVCNVIILVFQFVFRFTVFVFKNYLTTALYLLNFRATLPMAVFSIAPASSPEQLSTFCPLTDINRSPFIILPSMSADPPLNCEKKRGVTY